jgi:hypothetical protein
MSATLPHPFFVVLGFWQSFIVLKRFCRLTLAGPESEEIF